MTSTIKRHELKTDPAAFDAVRHGTKTHEIRFNDREFAVGDELLLRQTVFAAADLKPGQTNSYTGAELLRRVTHIQEGYGLAPGWVILSFDSEPAILKGIGRIDGDGWKDITKRGEVVFVWNTEMPRPHKAGQYPRVGNQCEWTASTDQYDFAPATPNEAREVIGGMISSDRDTISALQKNYDDMRGRLEAALEQRGKDLTQTTADYEEILAGHRRLVRELDVLLNGEAGAARQASLADIVAQVRREGIAALPQSARDVIAERRAQVTREGYDHENDDAHVQGELGAYAAYYAMPPGAREWPAAETGYGETWGEAIIPEGWTPPKPGDRRRELVKAGALVLAEIERIDRTGEGA
jgi:hypothetical protein